MQERWAANTAKVRPTRAKQQVSMEDVWGYCRPCLDSQSKHARSISARALVLIPFASEARPIVQFDEDTTGRSQGWNDLPWGPGTNLVMLQHRMLLNLQNRTDAFTIISFSLDPSASWSDIFAATLVQLFHL